MNKVLKIIAVLLSAAVISTSFAGCGNSSGEKKVITFKKYSEQETENEFNGNGVVCENSVWQLCWNNKTKQISFVEKASGAVWGQTPAEADKTEYQENGMPKKKNAQLQSAISVAYQDPTSLDEVYVYSYNGAFQNGAILAEKIDNGLRVIYDFYEFEFAVPVEYTINEKGFDITVNPTEISESGAYPITKIALAPFLCGLENNSENSWFFLPDGTGIVVKPFRSGTVGMTGSADVYGRDLSWQTYALGDLTGQINLPVFGVKKGDSSLLAVIDSNAANAAVSWILASENIGYSTVYPEFRLRGSNRIERPENFISITPLGAINIFTDGIVTTPVKLHYYALSGENADINGMAAAYRDYLIQNCGLKKSQKTEKTAMFKYVGAVDEKALFLGIPTTKLYALTTAKQAEKMTERLKDIAGSDIAIDLVGFGQTGLDIGKIAGGFGFAKELGGNGGIKTLSEYAKKNNISFFADFDLMSYSKSGGGYRLGSAARYESGQRITYGAFDTVSHNKTRDRFYLLGRSKLFAASEKLINKIEKLGLSGIAYNTLSKTAYSDYSEQKYYAAGEMAQDVTSIFENTKSAGFELLSSGANDYAAVSSDYIIDAPIYSSDYRFTSFDVPFYQMVFKGYIPMSSVSLNLCANHSDAMLRCVASGISPSYTLINGADRDLVSSEYAFLATSSFDSVLPDIKSDLESVSDYLKSVRGAEITDFQMIGDEVSLTRFDNGVFAVVNYGSDTAQTEFGEIPAGEWITGGMEK